MRFRLFQKTNFNQIYLSNLTQFQALKNTFFNKNLIEFFSRLSNKVSLNWTELHLSFLEIEQQSLEKGGDNPEKGTDVG